MDVVIYIIMSFLSLIGAATVIKSIAYLICKQGANNHICNVILLDNDNPEMVIRDAYEQIRFSGCHYGKILAFDCGMNDKAKNEARLLLLDYNIELCDKQNIGQKFSKG